MSRYQHGFRLNIPSVGPIGWLPNFDINGEVLLLLFVCLFTFKNISALSNRYWRSWMKVVNFLLQNSIRFTSSCWNLLLFIGIKNIQTKVVAALVFLSVARTRVYVKIWRATEISLD